jgi:hypothetical protein
MTPKKGLYFRKVNGRTPNQMLLEILVNGEIIERSLIQPNMMGPPTHVRIVGSNLFDEKIAYRLIDTEDYTDIIQQIKKTAKNRYGRQKGIFGFFSRPKIEIKYHKSHSLT